ncbi:ATP-binding protein [Streptomyces sp. NBC_00057]|uniref:ATP-binding protein n=1 Tax=Streptomyces sp. NBC_00057 TaxID=2975634 RepID=UPI00386524C1
MADRAVHRVVQEALANATKHAPGAPVTVTLVWQAETVEITVTNETPPPAPLPGPGSDPDPDPGPSLGGYGLVGLDERVRLAGGTLRAGPSAGGYEVSARLPLAPGAEPTPIDSRCAAPTHHQITRGARNGRFAIRRWSFRPGRGHHDEQVLAAGSSAGEAGYRRTNCVSRTPPERSTWSVTSVMCVVGFWVSLILRSFSGR